MSDITNITRDAVPGPTPRVIMRHIATDIAALLFVAVTMAVAVAMLFISVSLSMRAPAVEAPAVEAPAVEAPAVEAPAVEAPAVEAPGASHVEPAVNGNGQTFTEWVDSMAGQYGSGAVPPCEWEDASGADDLVVCAWDSTSRGNGYGYSYVMVGGPEGQSIMFNP